MRRAALIMGLFFATSCGLAPIGAWRLAASPPALNNGFGVTVALPGGRVGVFGDVAQSTGQPVARTLIYDSIADRWSQGAPIPEPRYAEAVATLKDGNVLFAGGSGPLSAGAPSVLKSTYLYDPARDAWRRAGDLNVARSSAQAVLLSDGRVLVVGGTSDRSAELFDPATGQWSDAGSMQGPATGELLAPLPNGGALTAGGCAEGAGNEPSSGIAGSEMFDESTHTWRSVSPMPDSRCGPAGLALADGRVLVVGGSAQFGQALENALLFDPKTGSWSNGGRIAAVGWQFSFRPIAITVLSGSRIFIPAATLGPKRGPLPTTVVGGQIYDSVSGDVSNTTSTATVTSARFGPEPQVVGAVALGSNRVFVLLEDSALVYDADASPPQTAVLDSSSLTILLVGVVMALLLAIAIAFAGARMRR